MKRFMRAFGDKARREGMFGVLRACLRRLNPRRQRHMCHPVESVLNNLVDCGEACIVQIGAFEGASENDPLHKILYNNREKLRKRNPEKLKVVLVEPLLQHFTKLVENYAFLPAARFENVAVAASSGESTLYHLAVRPGDYGYPDWLAQLSSLKRERMESVWDSYETNPDYQAFYLKHRAETVVRCVTLAELLDRHRITKVDLLQIDAEGAEDEILHSLPLSSCSFRFINFESVLLGDKSSRCQQLLYREGFNMVQYGQDTFCFKPRDKNLFQRWVGRVGRANARAFGGPA